MGTKVVDSKLNLFGYQIFAQSKIAYFFASSDSTGWGLFKTDGTNSGTRQVRLLSLVEANNYQLRALTDSLVFFTRFNVAANCNELWRSNGTIAGTYVIREHFTMAEPRFTAVGSILYFTDSTTLYKTSGTAASTVAIKTSDIVIGSMTAYKDMLFFAYYYGNDVGLWKTDGTTAGTLLITNNYSHVDGLTVSGSTLFFSAIGTTGMELYKSDGTTMGTGLLKDIRTIDNRSSIPMLFRDVSGELYFFANDGVNGQALWRSDGTTEGTRYVSNVGEGAGSEGYYPFTMVNVGKTVFIFNQQNQLWESDGTKDGTFLVNDNNLSGITYEGQVGVTGSQLFFTASSPQYSSELYVGNPVKISSDSLSFCPPLATTVLKSSIAGNTYQWQVSDSTGFKNIADTGFYTGTNTASLAINNLPSIYNGRQFRCKVDNGYSSTYTIQFKNNWNGTVSSAWENAINWDCGSLPDANTDVVITQGTVVINSNVSVKSLTLKPGASVTVNPGYTLLVNGK